MNKSKLWLNLTTTISAALCAGLFVGTFSVLQFSQGLPDAQGIREIELKVPLRVYSADGLLISEFGSERRIPVDYEDTPQALIDAVLASEDDNFFNHYGVDFMGLIRAALANFRSGRSGQGASTITMQVARNFYLTREKTYTRKINEILLAIRLENALAKQEILSLYLNKIYLGHRAYGFGAAAEAYYGKTLDQLNLAQIAMLAGLPKAPASYNPIRNAERAVIRRDYVLGRMRSLNWVTQPEYEAALAAPVTAKRHARDTGLDAPHIAEMVRAQLTEQYGKDAYWQGLNVYTTIDSNKQGAATAALRKGLQTYDRRHGFRGAVGRIDLAKLSSTEYEELTQAYEQALSDYPDSKEQTPAIVLAIEQSDEPKDLGVAKLWSRVVGELDLTFADAKWAKRHINANRLGPRPKRISDILTAGDIVYIKPKAELKPAKNAKQDEANSQAETQPEPKHWELSQLPAVSGSLVSMDPRSGGIISLVGGYDFFLNKYNRATQSIRQPGSNIKPFIYSASLDKGFTPASLISGAPIVLTDPAHGTRWRPENYSGKFFGPTRMRVALSKSMNLVSIRLLRAIGIPFARDYIARFGIDMSRFSSSLTMALGSGGVKPIEMISAYAVLANGGYRIKPYFIERITDRDGVPIFTAPKPAFCDECIAEYFPKPEPVDGLADNEVAFTTPSDEKGSDMQPWLDGVEPRGKESPNTYSAPRVMTHANNYLTVSMLKDVVRRGTARKAQALERQDLAGKTGTTNDYVDAWFTGFNSQVATTVWVGFDQPSSMGRGEAGSLAALPIWIDYMKTGLQDVPQDADKTPNYIEQGFVDRYSGERTDEGDPLATAESFVISDLTPERALKQQLAIDGSNKDLNQEIVKDALRDDSFDLDTLEGAELLGADGEVIDEDNTIDPAQRILDTEEDTEGLF